MSKHTPGRKSLTRFSVSSLRATAELAAREEDAKCWESLQRACQEAAAAGEFRYVWRVGDTEVSERMRAAMIKRLKEKQLEVTVDDAGHIVISWEEKRA